MFKRIVLLAASLSFTLAYAEGGPEIKIVNVTRGTEPPAESKFFGDQIFFEISNLEPRSEYKTTLWQESQGKFLRSWATFKSSEKGVIDTQNAKPTSGLYDLAD